MLQPDQEALIVEQAIRRGWLSRTSLIALEPQSPQPSPAMAASPQPSRWGPRIDRLVAVGALEPAAVDQLIVELSPNPTAAAVAVVAEQPPSPSPPFPIAHWERYEFLHCLGSGGMGIVYAARDRRLNRQVALKFIRGDRAGSALRFQQEARAQARIDHDCVCKVYEVGDVETKPYIAMEFIHGLPLQALKDQLSLEEKVQLMRDVASAAQAAHRLGIVHRDLKPSNVMVERRPDGSFRPVVMDFGLAHDPEAEHSLTQTGAVLGTPAYMSPEQARGDTRSIDRRSDVYSLGAMLYELLGGQPPFRGSSTVETLLKVAQEEPPALRTLFRAVPVDLEIITHKCLEKEPARRYESAQALAADLQAYLDGRSITARPRSLPSRLWRLARRHRWMIGMGGLVLCALIAQIVVSVRASAQAARQVRFAQRMTEQAREVEAVMRQGYMSPLHEMKRERRLAMELMAQIEREMASSGPLAEAPGHYALGRGYLAMQDFTTALSHLERAQRSGYRIPGLDYALGSTQAELYQIEWLRSERIAETQARNARRAELDRLYRQPAVLHLTAYAQVDGNATAGGEEYGAALLAYCRGDYAEALRRVRQVHQRTPFRYEAKRMEGDILMRLGNVDVGKEDYSSALLNFANAGAAYDLAAQFGRSDPLVQLGQVNRWVESLGASTLGLGRAPGREFESMKEAALNVLHADPEQSEAYRLQLRGYRYLMQYQHARGQLGIEFQQALELGEQLKRLHPTSSHEQAVELAEMYQIKGVYEIDRGLDPVASLQRAESLLDDFIAQERRHPAVSLAATDDAKTLLLHVYRDRVRAALESGRSPLLYFQKMDRWGMENEKTLSANREAAQVWPQVAMYKGDYEAKLGRSPLAFYQQALSTVQRVRAADARNGQRSLLEIEARLLREAAAGDKAAEALLPNPQELIDEIEAMADPWLRLRKIYMRIFIERAGLAVHKQQDPSADLDQAFDNLKKCQAHSGCDPADPEAIEIHILQARWALLANPVAPSANASIDAALKQGQAALTRALDTQRAGAVTYRAGAALKLLQAERAQRGATAALITEGLELTERAAAIDPQDMTTMALTGELLLLRGRTASDFATRRLAARQALTRFDDALRRNPRLQTRYAQLREEAARLAAIKAAGF